MKVNSDWQQTEQREAGSQPRRAASLSQAHTETDNPSHSWLQNCRQDPILGLRYMHVFGLWEEAGEAGEDGENVPSPHRKAPGPRDRTRNPPAVRLRC